MSEGPGVNAFLVLELGPEATRTEIERAGQRLLGLLQVGAARATTVETPEGPRPRGVDDVRAALATLRDPAARLGAELDLAVRRAGTPELDPSPTADLWAALGWSTPAGPSR